VKFEPGPVPRVEALVIGAEEPPMDADSLTPLELDPGKKGIAKLPVTANAPKHATQVWAVEVCLRYSLRDEPSCISNYLAEFVAADGRLACRVWEENELRQELITELESGKELPSADPLNEYASWKPDQAEALLVQQYAKTPATQLGNLVDLLGAMALLQGPTSLELLRRELQSSVPSVRFHALGSLAERDGSVDRPQILYQWATEESSELAQYALQRLDEPERQRACEQRLEKLLCGDVHLPVSCSRFSNLSALLEAWNARCAQ
jgi:hypothetical protein